MIMFIYQWSPFLGYRLPFIQYNLRQQGLCNTIQWNMKVFINYQIRRVDIYHVNIFQFGHK